MSDILDNLPTKKEEFAEEDERALMQAEATSVRDREDYQVGEALLKAFNDRVKLRQAYFKPMKDRAKAVHQDWVNAEKESIRILQEAMSVVKAKMNAWLAEQRKIAAQKEAELRAAAKEQGIPQEAVVVAKPEVGSTRTFYEFVVLDFTALPDEYKITDTKKLGDLARSSKGKAQVPGVKFTAIERAVVGR